MKFPLLPKKKKKKNHNTLAFLAQNLVGRVTNKTKFFFLIIKNKNKTKNITKQNPNYPKGGLNMKYG